MKYFLLFLLCIPCISFGQKFYTGVETSFSTPYQVVDNDYESFIYTKDSAAIISVKLTRSEIIVQKFDGATHEQIQRVVNEYSSSKYSFQDLVKSFNNKIFIIFETPGSRKEASALYAMEIDQDSLKLINTKKLLTFSSKIERSKLNSDFSVSQSFDGSHLLVNYRTKANYKDTTQKSGFHVFDEKMNLVWGREVELPFNPQKIAFTGYQLTDNHEVLTIVKTSPNKYQIVNIDDKKSIYNSIVLPDNIDSHLFLSNNNNSIISVIGLYGDEGLTRVPGTCVRGISIFKINRNGEVIDKDSIPLPKKTIYNVMSKRDSIELTEKELPLGIEALKLMSAKHRLNGEILLISEVSYSEPRHSTSLMGYGGSGSYSEGIKEDVVLLKLDREGNIIWSQNINKLQTADPEVFHKINNISYFHHFNKETNYILYFDHLDNAQLPENKDKMPRHLGGAGGMMTLFSVNDITGEKQRYNLFEITDIDGVSSYQFNVSNILVKDLTFVSEVYIKKKKDSLLKFTFQPMQ